MSVLVGFSPPPILQFLNNLGNPNANGTLLTQVGGVNYPTYQDSAGTIPLPNPIPLNSRGEISNSSGISCQLFLVVGVTYTFTLFDSGGNQLNQATFVNSASSSSTLPEWIQQNTPTFVSGTSFTVPGNQTSVFDVGRRVKSTNTGGTVYSTVSSSSFGAGVTTVTVTNDSGSLDSGLSAVSVGILDAVASSIPQGAPTANNITSNIAANASVANLAALSSALVPSVASIAALRALTNVVTQSITVQGYYVPGDGGGGTYVYKSTDLSSADNGGSIIVDASGHRWYLVYNDPLSVRQFGAKGDGSTNDYISINNAITAVTAAGGAVYFPPGNYLVNTALALTGDGIRLIGSCVDASSIFANSLNQQVLTVAGTRHAIENLLIYNNTLGTTGYIVQVNNAVECKIDNCKIQGGYIPLGLTGTATAGCVVTRTTVTFGAGPALLYIGSASGVNGDHHFNRVIFDQGYPVQVPTNANYKGARANTTGYNIGDVVTQAGYYWQCKVNGTSAASAPTTLWYGNNIVDGTVTWLLMGNVAACGVNIDSQTNNCTLYECDITGAFLTAVNFSNTLSATAPYGHQVSKCTAHGPIQNGAFATAGYELQFSFFETFNPTQSGVTTYGIGFGSGVNDCQILGCQTFGYTNGIYTNAKDTTINSNISLGNTTGILVDAGTLNFSIMGNICGSSTQRGANTTGIKVNTGTSDHYIIMGNVVNGATTGVTDNGSGANKTVASNF